MPTMSICPTFWKKNQASSALLNQQIVLAAQLWGKKTSSRLIAQDCADLISMWPETSFPKHESRESSYKYPRRYGKDLDDLCAPKTASVRSVNLQTTCAVYRVSSHNQVSKYERDEASRDGRKQRGESVMLSAWNHNLHLHSTCLTGSVAFRECCNVSLKDLDKEGTLKTPKSSWNV